MSLSSLDLMMAFRSTETHNVTLNNVTLFGPNSELPRVPTNQIARFVNYYGYDKYGRIFDSI